MSLETSKFAVASAGYSVTFRVRIKNNIGLMAKIVHQIAWSHCSIAEIDLEYADYKYTIRRMTVNAKDEASARDLLNCIDEFDFLELLDWQDDTLVMHEGGKLEVNSIADVHNSDQLSRAYTPGVARVCKKIAEDKELAYKYTIKNNCVAVISDGTAVLGLGDIGPEAAMPVMEGKAMLFKDFAGVDAFPICLDTQDTEEIISIVKNLAPTFGGVNLEDIAAPRCFEIEERLIEELDIPVFHDDQHGTAVVVLAGILNSVKLLGRKIEDMKVVVNGFGAGGVACTKILLEAGVKDIVVCDRAGIAYRGRKERMNPIKDQMVEITNPRNIKGDLADAMKGADIFLGVSMPGVVTREMVESMNPEPIIFTLANPVPEIFPDEISDIAGVIATGRSDYPNQVNNVLCFPGLFRGALDTRSRKITMGMKIACAEAIAGVIPESDLAKDNIIPSVFNKEVAGLVAMAVKKQAATEGVARYISQSIQLDK